MTMLIIGYGSIGKRHARLLAARGIPVCVVSRQPSTNGFVRHPGIAQALAESQATHAVICTATAKHANSLAALEAAGFTGKALVEKPLFAHASEHRAAAPFVIHVAYHLRFHPLIAALQSALRGKTVLSAHIYVGQHLSQWRPDRTAKDTYSAHAAQGGGVMRDLSHELDLAHHLFGAIGRHYAIAKRAGDVTADSEDVAGFVMEYARCPLATLQMNYLDHTPRREWIVTTQDATIKADFIAKTLTLGDQSQTLSFQPDDAYIAMHDAWLNDDPRVCSYDEALAITRIIDGVTYE